MLDLYCDMDDKVSPPATVTVPVTQMTGNDVLLGDIVEQKGSSIMDSRKKESSEWTNEKHSLYLKSIEASFVDQLYNSLDMQSWKTQKTCSSASISSRKHHAKAGIPSGQFKVLHGGCWSKKNFRRENHQLNDEDRPHVSPGNPWIQHFTNGSRHRAVAFPSLQERPSSTAASLQYPVWDPELHQELGCSNTEVTDQNFVEDDKPNRQCSRKRTKTSVVSRSSNDQVVPFCTYPPTENADSYVSLKK